MSEHALTSFELLPIDLLFFAVGNFLSFCMLYVFFAEWLQMLDDRIQKSVDKILVTDLTSDCIQSVLSLLNQGDVIRLMMTCRLLLSHCRVRLFRNVYVTYDTPIKPKRSKDGSCNHFGSDFTTVWTVIEPHQLWKMLNIYKFDASLLKSLHVDENTFSSKFLSTTVLGRISPTTMLSFMNPLSDYLLFRRLDSVKVGERTLFDTTRLKWLKKLTICDISSMTVFAPANLPRLVDLTLAGNPLKLQALFQTVTRLGRLCLVFNAPPAETHVAKLLIPTDNVVDFVLLFNSSYVTRNRPSYMEELDSIFLATLWFPKLKRISISSKDTKNLMFKYILPDFNGLLARVQSLEVLHLSMGCEFTISKFPALSKHSKSLKRLAWIGNMDEDFYSDYEMVRFLKFDMLRGSLLTSPLELGGVGRNIRSVGPHFNEKDLTNLQLFQTEMLQLSKQRGMNYLNLDHYNFCRNRLNREYEASQYFVENVMQACRTNFVPKYPKLGYMIVNGLHFEIFPTFDENRGMVSVYDNLTRDKMR